MKYLPIILISVVILLWAIVYFSTKRNKKSTGLQSLNPITSRKRNYSLNNVTGRDPWGNPQTNPNNRNYDTMEDPPSYVKTPKGRVPMRNDAGKWTSISEDNPMSEFSSMLSYNPITDNPQDAIKEVDHMDVDSLEKYGY